MQTFPQRTPEYLEYVTGLRGLAAFYVLLSHVWYQIWPAVPVPYGYELQPDGMVAWATGWLYYGHFGVVVFIVLSGFCLMRQVIANGGMLPGGATTFLKKRALRILPPYYAALFFSLLLIHFWIGEKTGSQWDISLPVTTSGILSHFLLLHDVIDSTQINYVFWTVALEAHLYIAFPLLLRLWRRAGPINTTVLCSCVIWSLIAFLETIGYREIPPQFIGLPLYFVFGMGCATLAMQETCRTASWGRMALVPGLVIVALCAAWGHELAEQRFALLDPLCALATCAILLEAGRDNMRKGIRAALENRLLVKMGFTSYSLYLIHAPLLQLVWQYAIAPFHLRFEYQFVCLLVLGVPASCMGARLFYLLCENRCKGRRARAQEHHWRQVPVGQESLSEGRLSRRAAHGSAI